MPFLDSPTVRPLYDHRAGGPPKAYQCRIRDIRNMHSDLCGRIVRTLNGMRAHQRIVHGIKQQQEFNFESVNPTAA
jgi:hypothetical protein